jgi:trimeric autotransporter adhesin
MITLACPQRRPFVQLQRVAGLALCALLALTASACGRSGLRSLGFTEPSGQAGAGGASSGAGGFAGTTGVGGFAGTASGAGGFAGFTGAGGFAGFTGAGGFAGFAGDGGFAGFAGVGGFAGTVAGPVPVKLVVAPQLLDLAVGTTGNLSATATYSDGSTAVVTAAATWFTDSMAAIVQSPGTVRAIFAGTAHITAQYGGLTAQGTVVVMTTISLVSIALEPPVATLPIGGSVDVHVIGTFSDGSTADVTPMAKIVDDGSGAAVASPSGHVVAVHAGTTIVSATVGALGAMMAVTVSPATVVSIAVLPPFGQAGVGTTAGFTASATLSDGTQSDVTASAMWSVGDGTIASISPSGVATGNAAGMTTVVAAFGGQMGQALLVVTGATLQTLQIDPVDPSVGVGVALAFTATGLYSDGTKVDLTSQVMWQSSSLMVLPIDAGGHATSQAVGTSVVTATLGMLTASSTVTVTPASLVSIAVTPPTTTLSPGGTAPLTATGTFSDGTTADVTSSVTWSASPPGVVSVSNAMGTSGVVTALAVGGATVTATMGLVSGAATVSVSAATLTKIVVSPASAMVPIGGSLPFTAAGTYSDGSVRDVTSQAAWASGANTIATVANAPGAGAVTGVAVGMVGITATLGGVVGMASVSVVAATLQTITVTPANATVTAGLRSNYTATGTYSDGSTLDITSQVTWTTGDTTVATVSNVSGASGQLLARAMGMTTVSATLGMVMGQTTINVVGATASSLSIAPIAASTPLGTGVQFTATLVFTNGTTRNVTGMGTWSSSNTMAATIGRTGRATPVAAGVTTIDVTYMGLDASTTLTVTDAIPTSIQITPIEPTMPVGTTQQFTVTAIMSDGTTRNVTAASTFVSDTPGVVGITTGRTGRGRATAVAAGSAIITATYMGFTDSATVTVTDATIVSISVSPVGLTLPVGTRRQFTAQAIRSDGTSMAITGNATWTSDTPGVAAVSTAGATRGQVTGISGGTATISATYMGITGSASVTVSAATLVQVQVTPFTPTISLNTPLQFVATAIFSDGTNVAVTGMATWLSSDMNVAQVSNAAGSRGLATSLLQGTTEISATYMNVTGSTLLTVTNATITQIQVTPFAPSVPAGFDRQLTATAIYSDGTNRDITSLATWTSADATTAAVSDALATKGLVTGVQGGAAAIMATYSGVSGMTTVSVSGATLTSLAIAPPNPTIMAGGIQTFMATGTFNDGSMLDVTQFVTWTSSNLSAADVSNADGSRGQATAFAAGTTTIQAQRGSVTATTTLTVQ